jgi:Mg2+ and Co2+ transporter CorA
MKAAQSLCTATVSTIDLKEELTDRSKKLTAWSGVLMVRNLII